VRFSANMILEGLRSDAIETLEAAYEGTSWYSIQHLERLCRIMHGMGAREFFADDSTALHMYSMLNEYHCVDWHKIKNDNVLNADQYLRTLVYTRDTPSR